MGGEREGKMTMKNVSLYAALALFLLDKGASAPGGNVSINTADDFIEREARRTVAEMKNRAANPSRKRRLREGKRT
jgi:hypothetical protein